jgi:hypothetical protein
VDAPTPPPAKDSSSFALRPDYPDFLNLPWELPLRRWKGACAELVELPRGLSRHTVVFVNYDGHLYALKELSSEMAELEYENLRAMEEIGLPIVTPVGHVHTETEAGPASVLITRYLDHSLPYYSLFMRTNLARYRDHLLDAMASLLVQLHLAGVYWGDCSLNNTLFLRDAGTLQAYFVDAETTELVGEISGGMRENDLDVMEENVGGGLMELAAMKILPADYPFAEVGAYIRQRYNALWHEITREVTLAPGERWRIQERVRALNALGFSVDEVELRAAATGERLRMRAIITDRNFHTDLLHSFTGLDVQEKQAQVMVNEIRELRATISDSSDRPMPLAVSAYYWLNEIYLPALKELEPIITANTDEAELYCQVLEHKWYMSEQDKRDVGHSAAILDFLKKFREKVAAESPPPETVLTELEIPGASSSRSRSPQGGSGRS